MKKFVYLVVIIIIVAVVIPTFVCAQDLTITASHANEDAEA